MLLNNQFYFHNELHSFILLFLVTHMKTFLCLLSTTPAPVGRPTDRLPQLQCSSTRKNLMNSFVINVGLRRLVARALCRRVRGIRNLLNGAVFNGRTWKLLEQDAPLAEVPKLQDIQFDQENRLIITERARIKAAPDSPCIENGLLQAKICPRGNGRIICLLEPDIALLFGKGFAWIMLSLYCIIGAFPK